MQPPSSNGSRMVGEANGASAGAQAEVSVRAGRNLASADLEERLLAIRTSHAPDILVRLGVLVSRRGGSLRSALSVSAGEGEGCTLVIVVAGAPRTVSRIPLWIAGLPDVESVTDLSAGANGEERDIRAKEQSIW